jgi:hypothetical protein
MKKMVLLVLLSVMSVGVAADNAHAIFGGRAWRVTARQEGFGLFGLRRSKTGRFFRKVENQSPTKVRIALDGQIKDWKFLEFERDDENPFKHYRDLK